MPKIDLQNLQKIEDDRFAEALAKVLRRHRKARGITRDGLAFQLGLHKNTLYGVEVGIKRKSGHFSHTQPASRFFRLSARRIPARSPYRGKRPLPSKKKHHIKMVLNYA